ncbi:LOW QUALITY PROTEIN: hypothetical protein V1477_016272 [Vespula maculifrons]|uniref:Uncharacterized protein n=1 Tax=Vespula maculifrons TaxID=7453 RepID=A0ABD2BCK0_VESMC
MRYEVFDVSILQYTIAKGTTSILNEAASFTLFQTVILQTALVSIGLEEEEEEEEEEVKKVTNPILFHFARFLSVQVQGCTVRYERAECVLKVTECANTMITLVET